MIIHWLAGCVIFKLWAVFFGWPIEDLSFKLPFLTFGAFIGFYSDYISLTIFNETESSISKWAHQYHNNFSHSLFFPLIILIFFWPIFGLEWAFVFFATLMSHPLIDLVGIGWGTKLFYPVSEQNFKMFFKGKIIYRFGDNDKKTIIKEKGFDNWWMRMVKLRKPLFWSGLSEYVSLVLIFLNFVI